MICATAKEWLMQAALPEELASAPPELADHLRSCDACRRLVQQLHRAERDWREQPLPPSAHVARDQFLRRHADKPAQPSASPARRRLAVPRWLVAASVLLAAGLTVWIMSEPQKAHAETDVIERLIDWNLDLSESGTAAERQQIYSERVGSLRADLGKLPREDRAFAESLLTTGEWLTSNTEPLEEADRFNTMADDIVERMHSAAERDDAGAAARTAKQYERVAARGIEAKLERAGKAAARDEARQQKLDKLLNREARRLKKLEKLHDAAPDLTRKEIRKLLEQSKSKGKRKSDKEKN